MPSAPRKAASCVRSWFRISLYRTLTHFRAFDPASCNLHKFAAHQSLPPIKDLLFTDTTSSDYWREAPFAQVIGITFIHVASAWIVGDSDKIWGFTWTCGLTAEVISAKQSAFWEERRGILDFHDVPPELPCGLSPSQL